jgi:hypothetical protein
MIIKEAELLFQAEALETPVIKKYGIENGWVVTLIGKHKMNPTLETARGHVRVFKTLDAAVGVLFDLGFEKINVVR